MISAENLTKQKSFNNVRFSFDNGIMGVVSPSEKDKSALLAVLSGASDSTDGKLEIECASIGYVAKGAPIPKNLKIGEYIGFVMKAKSTPFFPDELKEKLNGLNGHSIASFTNLQRYKAAIISELICEPELLILESPSLGLTFEETDELFTFIEEISETTPVIFSGERMSEIRKYADTALVMLNGKQLFFGTAQQLTEEAEKEGILTVKVKGDEETVKAVFEKYGADISQSVRKGTYKCVMNLPESEKAELRNAISVSGLALLEMKADGDDLKKLISALDEKENSLRVAYEEERAEKEIRTLNQLKDGALSFSHETEDPYEAEEEDEETSEEAPQKTASSLSEEEKERKRRALFGHSNDDDDDEDDGGSTLFSSKE